MKHQKTVCKASSSPNRRQSGPCSKPTGGKSAAPQMSEMTSPPANERRFEIFIDYVCITFKPRGDVHAECEALLTMAVLEEGEIHGQIRIEFRPGRGLYGWTHSATAFLVRGSKARQLAVVAWGGDSQLGRVYVQFASKGCAKVTKAGFGLIRDFLEAREGKVSRVDVTLDDLKGHASLDSFRKQYLNGEFCRAGRNPKMVEHINNDDSGDTISVGTRKGGLMVRIYEKGRMLGDTASEWIRVEVELRAIKRLIPLDVLVNPAPYFIGAYPALGRAYPNPEVVPVTIKTKSIENFLSLDKALRTAAASAGSFVAFMIHCNACPRKLVALMERSFGGLKERFEPQQVQDWLQQKG